MEDRHMEHEMETATILHGTGYPKPEALLPGFRCMRDAFGPS